MQQRRFGCIDAFWLKMIMALLMVLDHLYYRLLPQYLFWGHVAARVVAPMFCYLVTEGMIYTRNRRKYILRIFTFAFIMLVGNVLLFSIYGRWIQNSILMSMAIAAALIACIDRSKAAAGGKRILWAAASVGLFVICIVFSDFVEGSYMMPLMAVIFYYLRDRPVAMWVVYFLAFCSPYLLSYPVLGRLEAQFWMILAIIPITLYNGERGISNRFSKYFFYVFYPLHIWIIFFIEQYLGL